jgi:hypothetical protein
MDGVAVLNLQVITDDIVGALPAGELVEEDEEAICTAESLFCPAIDGLAYVGVPCLEIIVGLTLSDTGREEVSLASLQVP